MSPQTRQTRFTAAQSTNTYTHQHLIQVRYYLRQGGNVFVKVCLCVRRI